MNSVSLNFFDYFNIFVAVMRQRKGDFDVEVILNRDDVPGKLRSGF